MAKKPPLGLRIVPVELRSKSTVQLMKLGFDTADIAFYQGRREAEIYNWMAASRDAEYRRKARLAADRERTALLTS